MRPNEEIKIASFGPYISQKELHNFFQTIYEGLYVLFRFIKNRMILEIKCSTTDLHKDVNKQRTKSWM